MRVCAVVVSFNRMEKLENCISAIRRQTHQVGHLIVVDNASTDGSDGYIESLRCSTFTPVHLRENLGGAGGFWRGIREAGRGEYDFIWVMDDDCVPETDCLLRLVEVAGAALESRFFFSRVIGPDGLTENVPDVAWSRQVLDFLHLGAVPCQTASFTSLMFRTDDFKRVGSPMKELFIWGDDAEYSRRLSWGGYGLACGRSICRHDRNRGASYDVWNETDPRIIERYFYFYRNKFILMRRYYSLLSRRGAGLCYETVIALLRSLYSGDRSWSRISTVVRGVWAGCFFSYTAALKSSNETELTTFDRVGHDNMK
jgi:GT2 family glycosyltransferase